MTADLKVVPLQPLVSETAVAMARDLLARAEAGQVNFIAVLAVTPDGGILDGWTSGDNIRPFVVLGGLDVLHERFMRSEVEFR